MNSRAAGRRNGHQLAQSDPISTRTEYFFIPALPMELSQKVLSDVIIHMKYARYIPGLRRRELWDEICDRYEDMMVEKFPMLHHEITRHMPLVRSNKILPSMRALQFAGPAIAQNNCRIYNCAYMPVDDLRSFSEAMFLLLSGTGVGFSVQTRHVSQLPPIRKILNQKIFRPADSVEGWAECVRILLEAYFGKGDFFPVFDLSGIRPKGSHLITSGGTSPGPEPLRTGLSRISEILDRKKDGDLLRPIEAHDIMCHIANSVLLGGIRRAAMISLFSADDLEMLNAKSGNWWIDNEQRARANNSVLLVRSSIAREKFNELWNVIQASGSGEPGIYFTNDADWGTNPCGEIALRPFQFCNLCEINVSDVNDQQELNTRAKAASFFGTLQAAFTDFHYLRDTWKTTSEEDALIGVGMTGIASSQVLNLNLNEAAIHVVETNRLISSIIGINPAARSTTVKPSGTTSIVMGTSSGIHAWYNDYYLRRVRIGKNESLYYYLNDTQPHLLEEDKNNHAQAIIRIPIKAPEGAILRSENIADTLARIKKVNVEWIRATQGHSVNSNNVSATLYVKPDEWQFVRDWMWENRAYYNGLSVLPYDNGTYEQPPFENITKDQFESLVSKVRELDPSVILEQSDHTTAELESACTGSTCSIF